MSRSGRRGELDEFFEILVTSYDRKRGAVPGDGNLCWRPATDVYETAEAYIVQMDLAGLDPAKITVDFDGKLLVVRGVRPESADPGRKHFHTMEINVGPFERRVSLIDGVDPETATARYQGGFLYVTFQKGEGRQARRRQIDINR